MRYEAQEYDASCRAWHVKDRGRVLVESIYEEEATLIATALNFYERDRPRMLEARVKRLEEALESIQAVTPTTYPEVCLLAGKALEDTKGPES